MKYANHLIEAIEAGVTAGKAILDVYQTDFTVETKTDQSPLTLADRESQEIIQDRLSRFELPFVGEEGKSTPYATRKEWPTLWIVDPLDGTKEFVKRNGEFTVNIALVEGQRPVMGVVYAPVPQWLYFASTDIGAYKLDGIVAGPSPVRQNGGFEERMNELMQRGTRLPADHSLTTYTIMGSRSHPSPELEAFVENKKKEKGDVEFIAAGSSLKICLVAEGRADVYPRLGPTSEWDTAAGQAVAECAGAKMYTYETGDALKYNKEDILNPWFVVER